MDLDVLASAWRRRAERQRAERLARAERARESARRAAAVLRSEFDVDEVWLFGSLTSEPRHDAFDIDIAVRGLSPDRYFAALARVSDIASEPVDLVTLESSSQRVQNALTTTARRLDDG